MGWFGQIRDLNLCFQANQTFGTLCSRIKPCRITVGPQIESWSALTNHIKHPLPLQRQIINIQIFLHQLVSAHWQKPAATTHTGTNQIKTHFWIPIYNLPPHHTGGRLRPPKTTTPLWIWNLKRLASGARAASCQFWSFTVLERKSEYSVQTNKHLRSEMVLVKVYE